MLLTFLLFLPAAAQAQIPVLNVSTARLSFITSGTSPFPPAQQVRIRNSGSGSLTWRATTSAPWIVLQPADGGTPGTLTVTVDLGSLPAGDYSGRIVVTALGDADDSPAAIDVALTLVAAAKPASEPAPVAREVPSAAAEAPAADRESPSGQIRLSAPIGSRLPVTSALEIGAPPGSRAVAWTARSDQRWLTVEPSRGTTPSSVTVRAAPADLKPGEARATVQFVDNAGTPLLVVPVILTIGRDAVAAAADLAMSSAGLPPATRNLPYSQAIPIKGGTPPYDVRLIQGRLPPGLFLANGALSGVARVPGLFQFVLGVADSSAPPKKVAMPLAIRVVTIFAGTALSVTPPAVGLAFVATQRPPAARLAVSSGGQPLDWHATTDAAWLKLVPSDGVSPGFVQLEVNAQDLAAGTYVATVTVMMEGAPNSPARIPVQLTVRK
ncbi:MAG: putative Ig domain-containing protein [Acidobacteriota bacterium]